MGRALGGMMDLADLQRIEVVRGPQGTLYGKNTMAGAVNMVTARPTGEFGGSVKLTGGDLGRIDGELTVKRMKRTDTGWLLQACNPDFADIPIGDRNELHIWGVVTRVLRAHGQTRHRGRAKAPRTSRAPSTHVATAPRQLWCWDMTYLPAEIGGRWFYLYLILDAFSRKVVGWAMGEEMTANLVLAALNMALHTRNPESVIHHSDQGSQYTSLAFGQRCREMGVRPSMGTVGDAYDNAMAESFFASLECELIDRRSWRSFAEARMAVFTWIEGWYNPRRRHKGLGQKSPINFEKELHDQDKAAIPTVAELPSAGKLKT